MRSTPRSSTRFSLANSSTTILCRRGALAPRSTATNSPPCTDMGKTNRKKHYETEQNCYLLQWLSVIYRYLKITSMSADFVGLQHKIGRWVHTFPCISPEHRYCQPLPEELKTKHKNWYYKQLEFKRQSLWKSLLRTNLFLEPHRFALLSNAFNWISLCNNPNHSQ